MSTHLLTFSDDKKTVIRILGEVTEATSKKEVYEILEKMRQKSEINLPILKDAIYEAILSMELPWDNS